MLFRETHWNRDPQMKSWYQKYLDNYIEINKAGVWDLKWKCQSMAWLQSVKQRHVNYSKSNNNEERGMHFLHSFHHLKNFSSRCFSSWWLLIPSKWLHVWVASLCYLHPNFFKLTWQLSSNFSWPYFNQRCSFLFDTPVLKGPLLGRTIKCHPTNLNKANIVF